MSKPVLILEKSDYLLESVKNTDNEYILEGTFAEFGIENNNGRIYESGEYLPHLNYLNDKIKQNKLVGELDHPEKFDVSLKNVSHLIENLEYDESTNKVKGRIKLLNTPNGKQAQALIDGGVKLSISSRAAGIVESNKTVKIKKIFTYDLVADPGFSSAGLNRINESLGINNENIAIYEVNQEMLDKVTDDEVKSVLNDIMSFEPEHKANENENEYIQKEINNNPMDNTQNRTENYVTISDLDKYSKVVKESYNNLKGELDSIKENINTLKEQKESNVNESVDTTNIESKFKEIVEYLDYMSDNFNKQEKRLAKSVSFQKSLAENLDNSIEYSETIAKTVNGDFGKVKDYVNYLAKETDKVIGYTNYLAENFDVSIQHQDYIATKLNELVNYSNYLAENQDSIVEYSNYQTKALDKAISHQDYIAENLNDAINYMEYNASNLNDAINYTEYVAEKALPHIPNSKEESVNESLSNRIDNLIDAVKNQKTADVDFTGTGVSLLSESNKQRFDGLSFTDKQKVVDSLKGNQYQNEEQVLEAWKSALGEDKLEESFISNMPKEIQPVWESLDEAQQSVIRQRATYWDLSSPYKVRNFWLNQNLSSQKDEITLVNEQMKESEFYKKLNESQGSNEIENTLGYSRDSIANISQQLNLRKGS